MRILFLESHPMWIYGLPNGFKNAGHEVLTAELVNKHTIPRLIKTFKPDLIFTLGWTSTHQRKKQYWLKKFIKGSGIPHIYWATEDPTHTYSFSLPFLKRVKPDFIFTLCPRRVNFYKNRGMEAAHLDFGYDPSVHAPVQPIPDYKKSVVVVANAYPTILKKYPNHYRHQSLNTLIKPLLESDIRIDFWGKGWNEMGEILGREIPKEWIHDYLPYTEANKVYSSAHIVIGLQNHPTQLTQRTYEILSSGGFLLTMDIPEIRRLFQPGSDLIVSSSPTETIERVRYFLENYNKRVNIREQGKISVSKYSYQHRAEYILDTLMREQILPNANANQEEFINYEVVKGDSLSSIARQFNETVSKLIRLNHLSTDVIHPGQILRISRK